MSLVMLEDGREIELKDEEVSRVLYGLTRLQETKLGPVLNCIEVRDSKGTVLWQRRSE